MSLEAVRNLSIPEHIDLFYEKLDLECAKLRDVGVPLAIFVSSVEPKVSTPLTDAVAAAIYVA